MAFGDGQASSEGLGSGITDAMKAFRGAKKPTKPASKPPTTKPGGQFADAPYSMGSDAGAGASAAPASGGVDA
jgi:hypothetical protein